MVSKVMVNHGKTEIKMLAIFHGLMGKIVYRKNKSQNMANECVGT